VPAVLTSPLPQPAGPISSGSCSWPSPACARGEVTGLQALYVRAPDRRRNHHYIRVEWQLLELNGKFYLAPPKDGSRRHV